MTGIQIIGIMLVKNEDVHIERAIRNALDFCDKLIITDHQSTDHTFEICQRLGAEFPKIDLRRITQLVESSQAIAPYYGTNTWIFAVDGDEIFDPVGLQEMRRQLIAGEFENHWTLYPNTLNCIKLNLSARQAWGYLAPPSRAGARLFNFFMITDWIGATGERLHGDNIVFKEGFSAKSRRFLHQEMNWDDSYFRYLHTSFLKRSSLDKSSILNSRLNPDELLHIDSQKKLLSRLWVTLRVRMRQLLRRDWKNQKYKRGPIVQKDVSAFFGEG